MKKEHVAVLCLIALAAGFLAGRKTVLYETEIKYIQGDVVRDTVHFPVPVTEFVHDTIRLVEHDTVRTLIDWNTERYYTERMFDDGRGILDVSATVRFNRLQDISIANIPVYREVTNYKTVIWQPYIGVSYNTLNQASFIAGIYHKKTGIELQYISDFNRKIKGYGIGLRYKY